MPHLPNDCPLCGHNQVVNGRLKPVHQHSPPGEHQVPYKHAPTVGGEGSGLVTQNGNPVGPGCYIKPRPSVVLHDPK